MPAEALTNSMAARPPASAIGIPTRLSRDVGVELGRKIQATVIIKASTITATNQPLTGASLRMGNTRPRLLINIPGNGCSASAGPGQLSVLKAYQKNSFP